MSDMDYGLIAKALGAALAVKGAKKGISSFTNARNINKYAERAKVDYDVGNFYGSDPEAAYDAIDAQIKAVNDQKVANYIAQQGGLPQGPLAGVEKVYSSEVAPVNLERGKKELDGEFGGKELPAMLQLLQLFDGGLSQGQPLPPITPPVIRQNPNEPQMMEDPYVQDRTLRGGAAYHDTPELPEYVTDDMIKSAMTYANTRRGQDVTMRGQDLTRTTAQERIAELKRMNDARIKNMLDKIGIDKQRVALYAKSLAQRAGRAPSKVEIAQQMLRNGEIDQKQFKDFILHTPGGIGSVIKPDESPSSGGFGSSGNSGTPTFAEWDSD